MNQKIRLALILIFLISLSAGASYFNAVEHLKSFLQPASLKNFIAQFGYFAPVAFMALYYFLVLAFISAVALTVLAGILFGKIWGSIYVIIASTLAAQTAFFITRALGPEKLDNLKEKKGIGPLIKKVESQTSDHGFKSIFLLRCLFAPYMPLSYAAGMIKPLRARDFFFATFFTNLIFTPAFVFLGDSLLDGPKALILPLILVTLVLATPKIIKRIKPHADV